MTKRKTCIYDDHEPRDAVGAQRLSVERLQEWQRLEYGMFVHFGLASFNTDLANLTPADYQPGGPPDTDQWARVAREAGMRYIIFTAQHCNSLCMWHTDIEGVAHVGQTAEPTDMVAAFIESCGKYEIAPALYYSQSRFTPWADGFVAAGKGHQNYATREAMDGVKAQLDELLGRYGPVSEVWVDGPS